MSFFPNLKTFLEINIGSFHFSIAWYALLILTGAIVAYQLSIRSAKKLGYNIEVLENFFFSMFPLAILGARAYYVIFEWASYSSNPVSIFYIWEGGLAIHGGLIAAVIYAFFYFRNQGINLLRVGDCIMPNVLLAQVIGRWGNFMNQEAYGQIVSENYLNHFPNFIKENMFIEGFYRQPMFLYEGIGNLIGFLLITFIYKKYGRKKRGDLIYAYIAWYGLVRFFVEGFRSDSLMFMDLKVAQLISIVFIILGLLGIFGIYNKVFKKYYPFKSEKPIILFDVDGTLLDSQSLIYDSFIHTFKIYKPDYTLSEEELHSFMGPALVETFEKYFKKDKVKEVVECYREYNHKYHDERVKEIPHAKALITYLKANEYTIGAVSNKMEELVRRGLACIDLENEMDVIVCRNQVTYAKPNPESLIKACREAKYPVDDVIYVGDAVGDVLAAKNMGAYSIAFATNERSEKSLKASNPCRLINDLNEIKEIIKEEREWNEIVM